MKPRLILVALGLLTLTLLSFGLQAQGQPKTQERDDIITSEQQLARLFGDFQDALLRLKQKMARGTPEEKRRAEVLDKVLDECKNLAINQEFTKMIEILRLADLKNTGKLADLKDQSDILGGKLRRILDMLQDSKGDRLNKELNDLKNILKDLQKAIDDQRQAQAQTELKKTDNKELGKIQKAVTDKTAKVDKKIEDFLNKDKKDGKGGEAANLKGENKDGKGDGAKGEAKDAGKPKTGEAAKGQAKDAGKDSKGAKGETKPGDPKGGDPKSGAGDPKSGDPKSGAKSGEKGKEGAPDAGAKKSDNKSGEKGKEGASKGNKSGDNKKGQEGAPKDAGAKSGDPKSGDPKGAAKSGEAKPSDPKSGPPSQAKAGGGDPMGGGGKPKTGTPKEVQGGAAKGGDAKGGDSKGGDDAQGASKAGDSKDGQGVAKDGGGPAPMGGAGAPPPASAKSDGAPPPPPNGNPPPSKQNDDVAKSQKKIQEAGYDQKSAEDEIKKKDNATAAKKQADAIAKMEEAKKKLEKLLQQMREEEIERVLAALQARCEKMLAMQIQVLAGTKDTDVAILRNGDKKPTQFNKRDALKLSDNEKDIVAEANKCIDILEAEGSAVAFPEVFQQIRQDMIHVQKRLELTDVADVTQGIEQDIIDTLKEMIAALKKARDDNQNPPKPGPPGKAGKPGDQKLLELIQELKMVRSLQKRINDRTADRAKRFPGEEQARDPAIVRELRNLADRQQRIQEIVSRIAKGDNK